MAELIKIAELDLDTALIENKAVAVQQKIDALKQNISDLKKEQKATSEQTNAMAKELQFLEQTGQGATAQAQDLRNAIAQNQQASEQLTRQLVREQTELKKNQSDYRTYEQILQATTQGHLTQDKIITTTNGSIKELSSALSHNKQLYQQLTKEERENAQIGGKLLKVIQEQDQQYKALHKSIGNTQVEVGNYEEAIKKALFGTTGLGKSVIQLRDSFFVMKSGILGAWEILKKFSAGNKDLYISLTQTEDGARKVGVAKKILTTILYSTSTAFKVLRGAIISTGLGALIVLLGSVISYFTSTQEGIDKVSSVLTPLKEVFGSLLGVVQRLGKAFVDSFSPMFNIIKQIGSMVMDYLILPFKQVGAVFKSLGKAVTGDLKGAWNELKKPAVEFADNIGESAKKIGKSASEIADNFKGIGTSIGDAWERGKKIDELEKKLRQFRINLKTQTEDLNNQLAEQQKIIKDTEASTEQRLKAISKAKELQGQLTELLKQEKQYEVEILKLKSEGSDTTDEQKQEIADKQAEIQKLATDQTNAEKALTKDQNRIKKEAHREWLETKKNLLEQERTQLENYLTDQSATAKSLAERLQLEEQAKNQRISLLEQERQAGIISQNKYLKESQKIEQEFAKTRAELTIEATQREVAQMVEAQKSRITQGQRINDELISQETARIDAVYQAQIQALEQEKTLKTEARAWDYQQEEEHQQKLAQLKETQTQQVAELQKQYDQQQKQDQQTAQELERAERLLSLEQEGATKWEIQAQQLDEQFAQKRQKIEDDYTQGKLSFDNYQKSLTLNEKQHQQTRQQLEQATQEAKLSSAQQTLSLIKGALGEHTAAGKAAAVAEATINSYNAFTKALASAPPPFGQILAGVTLASGLANVKKIIETPTPKKFEQGGLVQGRSHAQGGVPFSVAGVGGYEMEGGEFIVNKHATRLFLPQLEALNQIGNKGVSGVKFFQRGGVVHRSILEHAKTEATPQKLEIALNTEEISRAIEKGAKIGTQHGTTTAVQEVGWEQFIQKQM